MNRLMEVSVRLEPDLFWKLAALAEKFDMRVDQYMVELATVASRRTVPDVIDPVIVRWRQGWSDRMIARELNLTNDAVGVRRRRFGVPANRKSRWAEEQAQMSAEANA